MDFTVTIQGLDELIVNTASAADKVQAVITAALQASANKIQSLARINLNPHHRTGNLQRSVLTMVDYPVANVTVNERYGLYIEQGTRPHDIYPVRKKALYWVGADHPVKVVHHPGTAADPFFTRAIAEANPYISEVFLKAANTILARMAGL